MSAPKKQPARSGDHFVEDPKAANVERIDRIGARPTTRVAAQASTLTRELAPQCGEAQCRDQMQDVVLLFMLRIEADGCVKLLCSNWFPSSCKVSRT
jgi:hypothetical protein